MPDTTKHVKKTQLSVQQKEAVSAQVDDAEKQAIKKWMVDTVGKVNVMLSASLDRFTSPKYLRSPYLGPGYVYDERGIENGIREPAKYILNLGGKRLRPLSAILVMDAFGVDSNKFLEFAVVPEVIHTGTLIHDDIEDNSDKRRDKDTVHKLYGVPKSINLGSTMFFLPLNAVFDSRKLDESVKFRMARYIIRDMTRLGVGQAIDISWHNQEVKLDSITEEQIMQCLANKTGALLGIAMKIGAAIGGADDHTLEKIGVLADQIGIAFQIRDDVLNITESDVAQNKGGAGEDITEGKVTVLVSYALQHSSKKEAVELVRILEEHTTDKKKIDRAIDIIRKSGAIEHAAQLENEHLNDAMKILEEVIPESDAKKKLRYIFGFMTTRTV